MKAPSKPAASWDTDVAVPFEVMRQVADIPAELSDGWVNQFRYFCRLWRHVESCVGDVVECGLGKGSTFTMLAYLIGSERGKRPRRLWGFDSFEGWPEPDASDASPRNPKKGEWGPEDRGITEEAIWKWLTDSRAADGLDIRITKGFLRDALPKFPRTHGIAFLHIDVDLYEGYRDALQYLYPLVMGGGVIAFDEYREFHPEFSDFVVDGHPIEKWPGCTKAVDEYLQDKGEVLRYHPPTQKYYIVKGSQ